MIKVVGGGVLHRETTINYSPLGTKISFEIFSFRFDPLLTGLMSVASLRVGTPLGFDRRVLIKSYIIIE